MDPYRNNQYNYRPTSYGLPPSTTFIPATKPLTSEEKLNTLFVGAIVPGITDEWIVALLEMCGNLMHWKRTKDPSGKPKGFGFATFADTDSVLCALRVLGGETTPGVTLKSLDGSPVEKKLIVKADDTVRKHLDDYQRQHQQANNQASDQERYDKVKQHLQTIYGEARDESDALAKELAFYKERAAQQDAKRFSRGPTEHSYPQDTLTDEEIERRRKEKHDRDVENAYHQREKRFEQREMVKMREYKKDMKREIELEERESKDKAYWLDRLAHWDDQVEMMRGEEPYYADRSRWRRMRDIQKRREEERDEEDRRRELQEIELEKQRLEEEEKRKKESRLLQRDATDDTKIALKPTKLNFNLNIKRNTLGGADDEEEEEAKKKRRVLVPLDYSGIETNVENDHEDLSPEERQRRVKDLIDSIPSSQAELWEYHVKWDELTEELIETKLHPFVSKKIMDLLGMEEEDLVNYVLQFIREKKGPNELVSELEGALDEDALVFVMKLWRALIFETERKYKHL
ncbi:uncharacterized protein B0P05DRAFT_636759 [Gilbertella persicaria]|uniref:PWI domain-containing protein n=1 Tax=Rhizopus stolonifer TaxID=4846 RepID=A0A367KR01_RHIST|nr:uncharacterized protein B0P05DRAFT_636759 [Gilbertella persicaria]KAI8081860.1 hypothetical protein B0P05DRAFT_636759 [Gilbertella persicaria]RCI04645.1 hypothetical protein CU098_011575 [Rhizopus stolonifer]